MISTDNPKHSRLRRIVSNAFNPRNVKAIEDSIERVADETIDRAISAGSGDFVTDIAAPFPLQIICDMMGVPPSEYATVLRCSNVILSMGDPDIVPEGTDPVLAFLEAGGTLTAIMNELGKYRVEHPIDDITDPMNCIDAGPGPGTVRTRPAHRHLDAQASLATSLYKCSRRLQQDRDIALEGLW